MTMNLLLSKFLSWGRGDPIDHEAHQTDVREQIAPLKDALKGAVEQLDCAQKKLDIAAAAISENILPAREKIDNVRAVVREASTKMERMHRALRS